MEAFRAAGGGKVKDRFQPQQQQQQGRSNTFRPAPKSKARSDNWMVNSGASKEEEARLGRAREMEMLMVARGQAIEEEELERQQEELERRQEGERKAQEMARLVEDLQRARAHTARDAEEVWLTCSLYNF